MEINVGDYVRHLGDIGLIKDICYCEQCKARGFYEPIVDFGHNRNNEYISNVWKDEIKSSKDIIDLIEVGDYVNGSKVIDIRIDEELEIGVESDNLIYHYIQNKEIKSILTHEQFEANAYKIEKER